MGLAAFLWDNSSSLTSQWMLLLFKSNSIKSPFSTQFNGPPAADSGLTCKITVPKPVPLIRPSDILTMSFTPFSNNFLGIPILPTSAIPG